jgi:hypothetical protein
VNSLKPAQFDVSGKDVGAQAATALLPIHEFEIEPDCAKTRHLMWQLPSGQGDGNAVPEVAIGAVRLCMH